MTEFKYDITVKGDAIVESKVIIDDANASSNMELGYFTSGAPAAYGLAGDGLGFYFVMGYNAVNPQIILGAPSGAGTAFLDTDFARNLQINTLPTGLGQGINGRGITIFGQGGIIVDSNNFGTAPNLTLTSQGNSQTWTMGVGSPGFDDENFVIEDETAGIPRLKIKNDGILSVEGTTDYELLVTDNDDIPNKLYVDQTVTNGIGASIPGVWKFDSSTSPGPSSGGFRVNNSNLSLVTQLYVHELSEPGSDFATIFSALGAGTKIYIQEIEESSEFILVTLNGPGTDNGSNWTFDVTVDDSGGLFDDGKECGFIIFGAVGGVTSIDDLSDVDTTTISPVFGNILLWDNSNWIPSETTTFRFTVNDGTCVANFIDTTGLDFCNTQIGPAAGSAFYIGQRALGTIATPTAVTSGLKLAGYAASGFDGTSYYVGSELQYFATEPFNGTDGGTRAAITVTPNGTKSSIVALNLEQDGTLNVSGVTDYETQVTDDDDIPNLKRITDIRARGYVESNGSSDNTINYNTVGATKVQYSGTSNTDGSGLITWNVANDSFDVTFTGRVRIQYNNPFVTSAARGYLEGHVIRDRGGATVQKGFCFGYTRNSGTDALRGAIQAFTEFDCISGDQFFVEMQRPPDGGSTTVHNMVEIAEFMIERIDNG